MSDEGITLVLDFTGRSPWDSIFEGVRRFWGVDVRKTTSSRTPGKVNVGIVHHGKTQLHDCAACGGKRYGDSGPHSPQVCGSNEVRDCRGALWRKEGGTWRVATNG